MYGIHSKIITVQSSIDKDNPWCLLVRKTAWSCCRFLVTDYVLLFLSNSIPVRYGFAGVGLKSCCYSQVRSTARLVRLDPLRSSKLVVGAPRITSKSFVQWYDGWEMGGCKRWCA